WNKDIGLLAFFTKSPYPPASYYQNGIKTTLLNLEREDPNIKIQREEYQKTVLAEREKTGSYEVLLVDQEGNVTEGSRSNLFIVKGDKLYTSPAKNVLLDRKSTRLNSSHVSISYAVFCLKKKK